MTNSPDDNGPHQLYQDQAGRSWVPEFDYLMEKKARQEAEQRSNRFEYEAQEAAADHRAALARAEAAEAKLFNAERDLTDLRLDYNALLTYGNEAPE